MQIHTSLLISHPMGEAIHSYSNTYEHISMPPFFNVSRGLSLVFCIRFRRSRWVLGITVAFEGQFKPVMYTKSELYASDLISDICMRRG